LAIALTTNARPYPAAHHPLWVKAYSVFVSPVVGQPGVLGTWIWFLAAPASIVVAVQAARRRERDAWLLAGILVTGVAMSGLSLARGEFGSWYYIPWLVAVSAVGTYGLARASRRTQIMTAFVILVIGSFGTQNALAKWSDREGDRTHAIELAKGVTTSGCTLYLANFDIEERVAIPLLYPFVNATPTPRCALGSTVGYVVVWRGVPLPQGFLARCRHRQMVATRGRVTEYRCPSFSSTAIPDQIAASGRPAVKVVRIRMPVHFPPAAALFRAPN
jgi:hypothetical protein